MSNNTTFYVSDNTTTTAHEFTVEKMIFLIITALMNGIGTIAYSYTTFLMIYFRKTTFANSYYTFAIWMAVPDIATLVTGSIYPFPAMVYGTKALPNWYRLVTGFICDVSWFVLAALMCVIAVNRLIAVSMLQKYPEYFTPLKVAILVACCWIYGFANAGFMYACTCEYVFADYSWVFSCGGPETCADAAMMVNMVVSYGKVVFVTLVYVLVFVKVRSISRQITATTDTALAAKMKKERSLVIQFASVCVVLDVYIGSFFVVPKMIAGGILSPMVGEGMLNTMWMLNSAMNPLIYLVFGTDIKTSTYELLEKFGFKKKATADSTAGGKWATKVDKTSAA